MTYRALRFILTTIGRGWQRWLLPLGLVLLWGVSRFPNPWDELLYATAGSELTLVIIPLYLLLVHRDLRHPAESLVALRAGHAGRWWMAHVMADGLVAVVVALGVALMSVVSALASGSWTWQWGPVARQKMGSAVLSTPLWHVPWEWGLADLGLLALGVWAMGVLMHTVGLWWRSPWAAWVAVAFVSFFSKVLRGTAAQVASWGMPGLQFSLAEHWVATPTLAPGWSVGYGVVLLAVAALAGLALADGAPWDGTHGGTV